MFMSALGRLRPVVILSAQRPLLSVKQMIKLISQLSKSEWPLQRISGHSNCWNSVAVTGSFRPEAGVGYSFNAEIGVSANSLKRYFHPWTKA